MKRLIALILVAVLMFSGCLAVDLNDSSANGAPEKSVDTKSDSDETSVDESYIVENSDITSVTDTTESSDGGNDSETSKDDPKFDLDDIPEFSGVPYVAVNDNIPNFSQSELTADSYESYAELDSLGRCGVTVASIGRDIMPTEERGEIGSVKPTGWHTVRYDIVDGKYLYNRCHLIGFQLTGENANTKNLITGTRYLNVRGMLPFENMVADYVKETGNHVAYRVTPIFDGNNLLASGVQMEGYSVEDDGEGICFNVYCYNVQPGIAIDYRDGSSELVPQDETSSGDTAATEYVLNTNSKKFHYPSCSSVDSISDKNRKDVTKSRDELIAEGYDPCGRCNP